MREFVEKIISSLEEETDCPNCSMYCADANICGFDEMRKQAINTINELAEEYKDSYVHRETFEQVMWERNMAISQLADLGYSLGETTNKDSNFCEWKSTKGFLNPFSITSCGEVDIYDSKGKFCTHCGKKIIFRKKGK